jgi:hypothetical protein
VDRPQGRKRALNEKPELETAPGFLFGRTQVVVFEAAMDRIQQLAQIVETQQMQIEHWKGVIVALSLVMRAEYEKLGPDEVQALLASIEQRVQRMQLTDSEIETVKATLRSLLRI